jgi:hypothetical protein
MQLFLDQPSGERDGRVAEARPATITGFTSAPRITLTVLTTSAEPPAPLSDAPPLRPIDEQCPGIRGLLVEESLELIVIFRDKAPEDLTIAVQGLASSEPLVPERPAQIRPPVVVWHASTVGDPRVPRRGPEG